MTEQGKNHGQRLKARDVLRLYAAGERDFRGTILRGCNFRGAELSGADFSRADIRGTNFSNASLYSIKFIQTKNGLSILGALTSIFCIINLISLFCILLGYCSYFIYLFTYKISNFWIENNLFISQESYQSLFAILFLIVYLILLSIYGLRWRIIVSIIFLTLTYFVIFTTYQGFKWISYLRPNNDQSVTFVFISFGFIVCYLAFYVLLKALNEIFIFRIKSAFIVIGLISISISVLISIGVSLGNYQAAFALFHTFSFENAFERIADSSEHLEAMIDSLNHFTEIIKVFVYAAPTFLVFSLSINAVYRDSRRMQSDNKFLNNISRVFSCIGGTSFSGANLTSSTFAYAQLRNTNFANSRYRSTILTHVRWHKAEGLDLARLGTSNLQDPRVQSLLTTLNGIDQDFSRAELNCANLAGAKLHRANFRRANLNESILQGAELHGANLTKSQCIGTDLTESHLTGVCLEAWNIDGTTVLKDIDCQYVYLLEHPNALGNRERLPHNPDRCFEPGDFEKYFREVLDEVKILIRGGVDPQAFKTAFQELMRKHQIMPEDVRGL